MGRKGLLDIYIYSYYIFILYVYMIPVSDKPPTNITGGAQPKESPKKNITTSARVGKNPLTQP
jgi:hypothetical protein